MSMAHYGKFLFTMCPRYSYTIQHPVPQMKQLSLECAPFFPQAVRPLRYGHLASRAFL